MVCLLTQRWFLPWLPACSGCVVAACVLTGCVLFRPEFTTTNSSIPIRSEFRLQSSPPSDLGVIDTSAVYVHRMGLARGTPPQDVPHYEYLRFAATGEATLSPFYPDSLDLQTAILRGRQGNFGFWTRKPEATTSGRSMHIKMEWYSVLQGNFIFQHAQVFPDSIVVYREEVRGIGYSERRRRVYKKEQDVFLPYRIEWPR